MLPLRDAVRSEIIQTRIEAVSRINLNRFQHDDNLCEALITLISDEDPFVLTAVYATILRIGEEHPSLQEILVIHLCKNIWGRPQITQMDQSVLITALEMWENAERTILIMLRDGMNYMIRFAIIHFVKQKVPTFYHRSVANIHQQIQFDFFKESHREPTFLKVFENYDSSFNLDSFLEDLLKYYKKYEISEFSIVVFLYKNINDFNQIVALLKKFLDIVEPDRFSYTMRTVCQQCSEEVRKEVFSRFTEDVRNCSSTCDEERFMCKMEVLGMTGKNCELVRYLLARIEILDSDCEVMRTRFAMTLLAVGYGKHYPYRTDSRRVNWFINQFVIKEIPHPCGTCEISLQKARLAAILVHFFIKDLDETSTKFYNETFSSLRVRLCGFQKCVNEYFNRTHSGPAHKIAKAIRETLKTVVYGKTRRGYVRPPFSRSLRIVKPREALKYVNANGLYIRRRNNIFLELPTE